MEFKECIAQYIQAHNLLTDSDVPVLVTLSGGADSVALLRVLIELGYTCHAAHCNFHLRGDESDRDEHFAAALCRELGVPFHLKHFDVNSYQKEHKVSVEMACRELRYVWFHELAAQLGCLAIAVAHHADDNVETFFLNALRGSGIDGLAAMKPRNGNIVRPLLCVSRADVEQYLVNLRQQFIVDSTNLENDYKRNKIRNVVLPTIDAQFPGSRHTLAATVEHVRDYADLLQDLMADLAGRLVSTKDGVTRISIPGLLQVKTSHMPLLLKNLLKDSNASFDLCSNIAQIITDNAQAGQHFYTSTHTLSLTTQDIVVEKTKDIESCEIKIDFSSIDKVKVKLELVPSNGVPFSPQMCDGKTVIALSSDVLNCRRVVLRHWRDGDRMRPFGLKGTKLLSDIFTDAKLSPETRKQMWLLEADGIILWVLGLRAGDAFRVPLGSTDYILLKS